MDAMVMARSMTAASPPPIALVDTHCVQERTGNVLRASSEALGWRNLLLLDFEEHACSATFPPVKDHLLVYQRCGTAVLSGTVGGRRSCRTVYTGQIHLVPADHDVTLSIDRDVGSLHMYVRAEMVRDVFEQLTGTGTAGLISQFAIHDQLLAGLIQSCARAMHRPVRTSAAYVEHLSWAIAAQLVEAYSTAPSSAPAHADKGLSASRLRAVDDYIHAHLEYDIGVSDMARAAGYSPVHFSRLFSRTLGIAPYRYLMERRMQAVRDALFSPARLSDIAAATGFCNQEHMTRAFRQHHGTTPGAYRREYADPVANA